MPYDVATQSRLDDHLKAIATGDTDNLPTPVSNLDYALLYLAENGLGIPAAGGGAIEVTWAEVKGKPATFPPVIGTTATTAKAGNYAPAWGDVTGKPSTFTPSAATTGAVGGVKKAAAQTDSTAEDIAGLVADFNALLAKLRAAGIM